MRRSRYGRLRGVGLIALGVIAMVWSAVLGLPAFAAPITVKAAADSYIRSDTPDTNYGSQYVLVTAAPSTTTANTISYIRFDVKGLAAPPAKVTLRLYSYANSASGLQVSTASNNWTETGLTFSNAPGVDQVVGTMPNVALNAWSMLDVTNAVSANGPYTFAVTTTITANKRLASRESGATSPQLVIEPATASTPASPTASESATATPTASTTPIATPTPTAAARTPTPTTTTSVSGPTSAPAGTSSTFNLTADATVRSDQPDTNAGTSYTLYAQAPTASGPEQRAYLKVAISGLAGTVTSASLQLYSFSTSTEGFEVATAASNWTEGGLTWNNAPPAGAPIAAARPLALNRYVAADLTSAIPGNGTYTFVLTTTRTSANKISSREASTQAPKLIVTTSAGPSSPTPTTAPPTAPQPSPSTPPIVTSPPTPTGSDLPTDPTIVSAGDIACPQTKVPTATSCQQLATGDLASSLHPDAVLPLGDNQYELGGIEDYQARYDSSWGRLKSISYPAAGNHEYGYIGTAVEPTGGVGYFEYFGTRSHPLDPACTSGCKSWYSYDLGSWHLISLDSQCAVIGGCNPGNPQYTWLLNDLNTHTNKCTLAYWHIPLYSSSQDHQPDMQSIYKLLYDKGADVVLNGHAHFYERFGPQDAAGNADATAGVREFLVGTGGRSFFAVRATPAANSEVRIANTFGVLQMVLHSGSYSWKFVPVAGATATDSGRATCH